MGGRAETRRSPWEQEQCQESTYSNSELTPTKRRPDRKSRTVSHHFARYGVAPDSGGRRQEQQAGTRPLFMLAPASCLLPPATCHLLPVLPSQRHANRPHVTAPVEGTQTDRVLARSQIRNVDRVALISTIRDSVVGKY